MYTHASNAHGDIVILFGCVIVQIIFDDSIAPLGKSTRKKRRRECVRKLAHVFCTRVPSGRAWLTQSKPCNCAICMIDYSTLATASARHYI